VAILLQSGSASKPDDLRKNHQQRIWCLAVSPGGGRILTGSNDGPARLWDVQTGQELHRFDDAMHCASVAISPDGQRALAGGFDNTIRLWQLTR
jgi:WD40 repeat protein